ncbi:hypothetical protein N665_0071s0003 [Sinapis alba]|nr:hypothetical protein N665_0071s0003 [Sinapis alba]
MSLKNDSDAAIKPVADPEVDPTAPSTRPGAHQDIWSLKIPYLTNQEGFIHETNFQGFYTHGESKYNWNQPKIYPEQKDMNFTNWRFASPSICEGPSLEAVSSPMKKESDPNQIMEVKMGFLAF